MLSPLCHTNDQRYPKIANCQNYFDWKLRHFALAAVCCPAQHHERSNHRGQILSPSMDRPGCSETFEHIESIETIRCSFCSTFCQLLSRLSHFHSDNMWTPGDTAQAQKPSVISEKGSESQSQLVVASGNGHQSSIALSLCGTAVTKDAPATPATPISEPNTPIMRTSSYGAPGTPEARMWREQQCHRCHSHTHEISRSEHLVEELEILVKCWVLTEFWRNWDLLWRSEDD